jgi:hypothetical protein
MQQITWTAKMAQSLKKHPGGRPTKYNKTILDAAWAYIDDYGKHGDKVPSIAIEKHYIDGRMIEQKKSFPTSSTSYSVLKSVH